MKQTPVHDGYNPDLLKIMPRSASRVVEVGCSSGALARAYKEINPGACYVGIEIVPEYANLARAYCDETIVSDLGQWSESDYARYAQTDCWVFGDVLEHIYDPWTVLKYVASTLSRDGCVVACVPNMQHWSIQARINFGFLQYEDAGLLDRTHVRWFTRNTLLELFQSAGLTVVEMLSRDSEGAARQKALEGVRAMALALGGDPDQAVSDATPFQYVLRAVRTP